jgi:uncharacterized protein YegL
MKLKGKRRFPIIPAGYAAIVLMLLLAIWNPPVPLGSEPVDLLLLLDESNSTDPLENDAIWRSILRQADQLPPDSRLSLIRFADRARVEVPWTAIRDASFEALVHNDDTPRHRLLDQGATSIGPALMSAIRHTSAERRTAVLISSDGIDNINPTEVSLPVSNDNPDLSIFYRKSAGDRQDAGLMITSINLPPRSSSGQTLPFSIAVKSDSGGQGTIETLLNGRVVDTQSPKLAAGEQRVLHHHLLIDQAGTTSLEFITKDEHGNETGRHRRLLDNRNGKQVLYIGKRTDSSTFSPPEPNEWKFESLQPGRIPVDDAFFKQFTVVIIDDLAAGEIDASVTRSLLSTVEQYGTGLIVLGGPHSFGSGGYRHSELERALPVISEASRQLPGAAFLFLIDKSGSMEASSNGDSRLAHALKAVSESAKSLRAGDESALLVFDREVEVLLPLERRADAVGAIDQPWQLQPSGGTQLAPALWEAIDQLAGSNSKHRYVLLVTDGFVDEKNLVPLKAALREASIQLIPLAIGRDADLSTLQALANTGEARLLRVDDTAELPRFMRQELETRQHSWNNTTVTPRTLQHAPFVGGPGRTMREIHGYQRTRAKQSARIYVAADEGNPLLATGQYGAGRVAVLPGGILETVSGDDLLSGLLDWMDSHRQNPNLNVTHSYLSGQLTISVDAIDRDSRWHPATTAGMTLTYPGGVTRLHRLEAVAPGRFEAVIEAPIAGIYSARIEVGNEQTFYSAILANDREHSHNIIVPWLERALASGEIQRWTGSSMNDSLTSSYGSLPTRPFWLLLALVSYFSLIVYERSGGLRTLAGSLLQRMISG